MTNEQLEAAIQSAWERVRGTAQNEAIWFDMAEHLRALLAVQKVRASMAETV